MRFSILHCDFATPCPQRWEEMVPGQDPGERSCPTCQKTVYFVEQRSELEAHAKLGHCVAAVVGGVTIAGGLSPVDPHKRIEILGAPEDAGELRAALKQGRKHAKR